MSSDKTAWKNRTISHHQSSSASLWEEAGHWLVCHELGTLEPTEEPRHVVWSWYILILPWLCVKCRGSVKDRRPTASSAAIQAQVAPSLGPMCLLEPYEGAWLTCAAFDASNWSGVTHEETGLQQNGTRSSLPRNPDSMSAVMIIVFECGDPVVNSSILPLLYSHTLLLQLPWYVHDILQPYELPLMQPFPGAILQQNNVGPHSEGVPQDCLRTVTTLPWPS
ncbi:transposable element Tcb2 transposase [Trichonephila clavipes]|nr:transposable element Tcb2 transposase [Trichonephila clavipes]